MHNLDDLIRLALEEDLGDGDHTSLATIPSGTLGKAMLIIKEEGVLAGSEVAKKVFNTIDPALAFNSLIEDGTDVFPRDIAFTVRVRSNPFLQGSVLH